MCPDNMVKKESADNMIQPVRNAATGKSAPDFRAVLDAAREIIFIFDENGRIRFANQGGLDITGYLEDEILGMDMADILPPDQLETLRQQMLAPTSDAQGIVLYEAGLINRDLELIPVEINGRTIHKSGQPPEFLFIARDIRWRKMQEQARSRNLKTAFLERIAAGIADDLNNLLTPVMGNIELARTDLAPDSRAVERLEDAGTGCMEIRAFIRKLMRFAGTGAPFKALVTAEEIVRQAADAELARHGNIRCEIRADRDIRPVEVDSSEMVPAFRHIIRNAADAMSGNGRISIRIENSPAGETVIRFQDTGTGIAPDDMDRIFDPYFSTRPEGHRRGHGLGLTFADAVVRQHGGHIEVVSSPNRKTLVSVFLPGSGKEADEKKAQESPEKISDSRGRILLMDDEAIVRDVAGQMLEQLGYTPGFASDGDEAVVMYREAMLAERPFDAVILDLNVRNGMGGRDTMQALLRLDPEVRGIVSSGYSNDPEMTDFRNYGFSAVAEKPYSLNDLEAVLMRTISNSKRE